MLPEAPWPWKGRVIGMTYCPAAGKLVVNFHLNECEDSGPKIFWRPLGPEANYSPIPFPPATSGSRFLDMYVIPGTTTLLFMHWLLERHRNGDEEVEQYRPPDLCICNLSTDPIQAEPIPIELPENVALHTILGGETPTAIYCSTLVYEGDDLAPALARVNLETRKAEIIEKITGVRYR